MYSDLYLQQKQERKVPKVFLLSIVAFFALVASQIFSWYSTAPAQASPVRMVSQSVGNISDTSVTVFFETNERCQAYILYGIDANKLDKTAYMAGENAGQFASHTLHLISLTNLEPDTEYFYKIIADGKVVQSPSGTPFSLRTNPQKTIATSARQPIYGRVVRPDGSGLDRAHVLVESKTSAEKNTYFATTKESGEWLVTLPSNYEGTTPLSITIMYEGLNTSHIRATVNRASPLPQSTVIGSDYTFLSEGANVLPASTKRDDEKTYPISLLYPEKDAIIPNTRPLFKGYGVPGTQVFVRVNSRPAYDGQVVVNKQGIWILEPSCPFIAGRYIVMVTVQDNVGQSRIFSRPFVIAKSGEQVLGERTVATPSGSMTPSRIPSPSLAFSIITPTIAGSLPPAIVITATPPPFVSPTGELQKAGIELSIWWPIVGSFFMAVGLFLVRASSTSSG